MRKRSEITDYQIRKLAERPGVRRMSPEEQRTRAETAARVRAELATRGLLEVDEPIDVLNAHVEPDPPPTPPVAFAEEESTTSEFLKRMRRGKIEAAKTGRHQGNVPFGYKSVDGRLEVHPLEAPVVKLLFKQFLALRGGLVRTTKHLNMLRVANRRGRPWSTAGLHYLLRNEVYVGRVVFAGHKHVGTHLRIVSAITFNLVGKILRENRKS